MTAVTGCTATGKTIAKANEDATRLTAQNGQARVVVDGSVGRIVEYSLQDGAATNVIWFNPDARDRKYFVGGWLNWGGDKLWPWPQSRWGWPPPEPKGGYKLEARDGTIVMTGEMAAQKLRAVREIELDDQTSTMVVTSRFEPTELAFTDPIGVWSITQVPHPKKIFVRIPNVGDRKRFLSRERVKDDRFGGKLVGNAVVDLEPNWSAGGKCFMDGDVIAAVYDDVILLQRLVPVHTWGNWAPDERCQVYVQPVNSPNVPANYSYVELEWTAPVAPPMHIAKAPLRVAYKLVRIKPGTTQEEIVRMVDELP